MGVDFSKGGITPVQVWSFLSVNKMINSVRSPIPLLYCFESGNTASELQDNFLPMMNGCSFVLLEVKPDQLGGMADNSFWYWLGEIANKQQPRNALGLLLQHYKGGSNAG
jgi:hypothetical protein